MSSKASASPSPSPVPGVSSSALAKEGSDDGSQSLEAPSEVSQSQPPKPEDNENEKGESPAEAETSAPTDTPLPTNAHIQGDWQAVWSPQHNTYYFFNMRTNETTWTNPLAGSSEAGPSSSASAATARYDAEAAAAAQGIDPSLAYLDPSLAAGPSNPAAFTYAAKFNARTGAFARPDARNPDHVSEYERMKRMSSFYFDMDEWQKDVEKRQAEEEEAGKKRKKPTKKDLELYKDRKKQKKLAKTAWLRT